MSSPTHRIEDLLACQDEYEDGFPWTVVGVFPTEDMDPISASHSWFNYTVGLGLYELWAPCESIEGRGLGNDVLGEIINTFACAWRAGVLAMGDNVIVPLGIPDANGEWERDADSIWWVSTYWVPSRVKGVNLQPRADRCVPIIWSSPLGWPDE